MVLQTIKNRLFQSRCDTDRTYTLYITVPADGQQTRAGFTHHAAHQREIDDGAHVVGTVKMMGNAHRPGENRMTRPGIDSGDSVDRFTIDTAAGYDPVPGK